MKNIYIMDFDKAVNELITREEEHAIIYLFSDKEKPDHPFRESFRRKKGCVDLVEVPIDDGGLELHNWQADSIIRLCERCINTEDVFIVHENMINVAMNIADEIALCYDLSFEVKDIPRNEHIRKMIRVQHNKNRNSLFYTMSPLEYCKKILEITFDQVRQSLKGELEIYGGYFFFCNRQCDVMLKSGLHLNYHLETFIENIYIPNMDDIEYVQFVYNVPEIANPSCDEENDRNLYYFKYNGECQYGICDHYGNAFGYNSIDGITLGKTPIPEKYKNYRTIQREYWEFYKEKAKTHIYPETKDAYIGIISAENFLAERNGYKHVFYRLSKRNVKKIVNYSGFGSDEFFEWFLSVLKEKNIFNGDKIEIACAYAAFLYNDMLTGCGHCENMTVIPYLFEKRYSENEITAKMAKFWDIGSYTPSTDTDAVNQLCLAAYTLIETVRPFNGKVISKGTYEKCLERIYELTEGRPELNKAVIMTGAFAGAYCQPTVE